MKVRRLTREISVSSQIKTKDIAELVRLGFKSIICNRPDGEGFFQPKFIEIELAAKGAGLSALYHPVGTGEISEADVIAFGQKVKELPKPVIAYCGSGGRSMSLWSLYLASNGGSGV